MVPSSILFDQSVLQQMLDVDPVVLDYRSFFADLDWPRVQQWHAQRSSRGRPAHAESAYLKAFLVRIREGRSYTSQLRRFLLKHPLLVIELGFQLVLDPSAPYGFECQRTLPSEQWLRENNPNVYVKDSFNVSHIPKGDPDCRLGVKKSSNQVQPDGSTKKKKVSLFGYGTGVAACTNPTYGDVVLAEYTLPFHAADVTYFRPLYRRAVVALDQFPIYIAADAAYDLWYVYETVAHRQGIAAIALNTHGHEDVSRDPDGTPYCSKGLRMHPVFFFQHTNGFRARRFRCPLLFPQRTGEVCTHDQFAKGRGCVQGAQRSELGERRVDASLARSR